MFKILEHLPYLNVIRIIPKLKMLKLTDYHTFSALFLANHHILIINFLINMQMQGHHPHQWAAFQVAG